MRIRLTREALAFMKDVRELEDLAVLEALVAREHKRRELVAAT